MISCLLPCVSQSCIWRDRRAVKKVHGSSLSLLPVSVSLCPHFSLIPPLILSLTSFPFSSSSLSQGNSSMAQFRIRVSQPKKTIALDDVAPPSSLSIGLPGFKCGAPERTAPSVFKVGGYCSVGGQQAHTRRRRGSPLARGLEGGGWVGRMGPLPLL